MKKSIYALAVEEMEKQRKERLPHISPERLQELREQGRELRKAARKRLYPPSMPKNARGKDSMSIVLDGASNRRVGGSRRNIQLD